MYMAQAQIDLTFCNIDNITNFDDTHPLPSLQGDLTYHVDIEHTSDKISGLTEEIHIIYAGSLNMAHSRTLAINKAIEQYIYPDTNELIIVNSTDNECLVKNTKNDPKQVEKESSFMLVNVNNKQTVVSGSFGMLDSIRKYVDTNLQVRYLGNRKAIRNIPVKQWFSCLYDHETQTTSQVTVSYSDDFDWKPAQFPDLKSVPVQVEIKSKQGGQVNTDISTIIRYSEEDSDSVSLRTELSTPKSIYCADRVSSKKFPTLEDQYSVWTEHAIPDPGTGDMSGKVSSVRSLYDFKRGYIINMYHEGGHPTKEIHDWNTGLKYKEVFDTHECEITKLSPDDEVTLAHLSTLDQKPDFQYSGQRVVRGIDTDVWVAPRVMADNKSVVFEYHFSSEKWSMNEGLAIKTAVPVLLVVYSDKPNQKLAPDFFHFSGFDSTETDLFELETRSCMHKLDLVYDVLHIRFQMKPDESVYNEMIVDQKKVGSVLKQALLDQTHVRELRIDNGDLVFTNMTLFVTFSMHEKAAFLGKDDVYEVDLKTAEESLKSAIDLQQFMLSYKDSNTRVEPNSYILLDRRDGLFIHETKIEGETLNYTLGTTIAFIVVFIVVGLAIGFVSGYFLIIKRSEPMPKLPGPLSILNPNFNEASNSNA